MENPQPPPSHPDVRHQDTGFSARGVGWFSAGLIATVVLSGILMGLLFSFLLRWYPPGRRALPAELRYEEVPNPKLDVSPQLDLQQMKAREDSILNSYGWVDRNAGVVRIPIARAMELLAERKLPVRQPPRPGEFQPEGKTTPFLPPPPGSPLRGAAYEGK
jgi:hypothetical protein